MLSCSDGVVFTEDYLTYRDGEKVNLFSSCQSRNMTCIVFFDFNRFKKNPDHFPHAS